MKSQLFLLTTLVYIATVKLNAQILYHDYNPDPTLDMQEGSYGDIFLDIDGDNADDARFLYTNYPAFNLWNLGIQQIDSNNPKIEIIYDINIPTGAISDYVKALSFNDVISAQSNFTHDYPQVGDIYNPNFLGQSGKYIGFRLKAGTGYKYGWFSVSLTGSGNMTFTIDEMAYQSTVNMAIKAGETGSMGLTDLKTGKIDIRVFPNPATDNIHIQYDDNEEIHFLRIYSFEGRLVRQLESPAFPLEVDLSSLNAGVFLLQFEGEGLTLQRTIVKK